MARGNTKSLVLEVAANATKLDAGVKAARSVLAGFKGDVQSLEAEVKRAFADLGGDGAARSARQAEAEFNRMFRSIKSNAEAIASEGNGGIALKLFDLGAADEKIRALTSAAGELRQVGQAATQAAAAGGEFVDRQRQMAAAAFANAEQLEQEALALDQTASAMREVQARMGTHVQGTNAAAASSRAFAAGAQQVGFQMSDFVVQVSGGTSAVRAFSMQGPQMVQALALMGGGAQNSNSKFAKFAGFLAGPWGAAITVAASVAGLLATSLLEADDAADQAEAGANALVSAQSALGGIFDLTTGKIKSQNEMLRLNARLMAITLRGEALKEGASSKKTLGEAGQRDPGSFFDNMAGDLPIKSEGAKNATQIQAIINAWRRGSLTPEQVLSRSEHLDFSGTRVTREQFQQAVIDAASSTNKAEIAGLIDKSLNENSLDPGLRQAGGKASHGKADHSAEQTAKEALQRARALEDAQADADKSILGALLKRAETEDERLAIQLQQLAAETVSRDRAIDRQVKDGELTVAQAAELKAKWAKVDQLEKEAVQAEAQQKILDQQFDLEREEAAGQIDYLRLKAQLVTTLAERREVAQQILELEIEQRKKAAEQLLASTNPVDQQRGADIIANLNAERAAGQRSIDEQYADPIERYLQHLREAAGDTNEALQQVRADGLASLEDGLVAVITGTESLGSAFKRMANQIIADLVRIGVQRAILGGMSGGSAGGGGGLLGAVFGLFGGGGGGASQLDNPFGGIYADGGLVLGPGTARSDSIVARVSNGEFVVNAASTARFLPLLEAINAGTPAFADGGLVSVPRLPAAGSLRGMPAGGDTVTIPITINAPGATAETVAMIRRELAAAAPTIVQAATANTLRTASRRSI